MGDAATGDGAPPADASEGCVDPGGSPPDPLPWPPGDRQIAVRDVEVVRLNCDAADDLVITSDPVEDDGVYVLLGGPAHGSVYDGFVSTDGAPPLRVRFAQVGDSAQPELLMTTISPSSGELELRVHRGIDAVSYAAPYVRVIGETFASAGNSFLIAVGDFDGDADPDLVVGDIFQVWTAELAWDGAEFSAGQLTPLEGIGGQPWMDALTPRAVPSRDSPGVDDILMARAYGATILRNSGSGSFPLADYLSAAPEESGVATALWDFEGDGEPEVVATQLNTPVWLLSPREQQRIAMGKGDDQGPDDNEGFLDDFEIGHLGGSPDLPDLVWSDARDADDIIYVLADLEFDGENTFDTARTLRRWTHPAGSTAGPVAIGDFDGDGTGELLAVDPLTGAITCLAYQGEAGSEEIVPCEARQRTRHGAR
jgi:hypothetical protein